MVTEKQAMGNSKMNPDRGRAIFRTFGIACAVLFVVGVLAGAASLTAKEKKPVRLVTGLVSDEAENPITGATVTLTDLQTGKKSASYTGPDGRYLFSGLETTREYDVQATHNGIASRVRKVSTIDPRTKITLNLQVPPPKEDE